MCIRAAGVAVYNLSESAPRFLLLENARHGTWGFPKGHLNPGEDLREAAARECEEETGLKVKNFEPDFRKQVIYEYWDSDENRFVRKRTDYFLSCQNTNLVHLSEEHTRYQWAPRLGVRKRLQFDNLRESSDCAYAAVAARLGLPHGDLAAAQSLLAASSHPGEQWRMHCLKVSETARSIAQGVLEKEGDLPLDIEYIEAAALLHDIGRSRDHGIEHPCRGMELLFEEGLGHLAKPCISHWLKGRNRKELEKNPYFTPSRLDALFRTLDLSTITLSEKIIAVADSLVQQDKMVRIDERYVDARNRYGDSHWLRKNEEITTTFIGEIEGILGGPLYDLLGL